MMILIDVTRSIFRVNLETFKRIKAVHTNYPKTHDIIGIKMWVALEA